MSSLYGDPRFTVRDVLRTLPAGPSEGALLDSAELAEDLERLDAAEPTAAVVGQYLQLARACLQDQSLLFEAQRCTAAALAAALQVRDAELIAQAALLRAQHLSSVGNPLDALQVLSVMPADVQPTDQTGARLEEARALIYFEMQLYGQAADNLDALQKSAPLSALAEVRRAASLLLAQRPDRAAAELKAIAAKLDGAAWPAAACFEARFWLAAWHLLTGQPQAAEAQAHALRTAACADDRAAEPELMADSIDAMVLSRTGDELTATAKLVSVRHRSRRYWPRPRWLHEAYRLCLTEHCGELMRRAYIDYLDSERMEDAHRQWTAQTGSLDSPSYMEPLRSKEAILADTVEREVGKALGVLFETAVQAELREDASGEHTLRVSRLARLLAERCGKDPAFCRDIEKAAAWHDIGKIAIPDQVVLIRGPLTAEQRDAMRDHTTIGADLLSQQAIEHSAIAMGVQIARSHHESFDGSGYPDALSGASIPEAARMTALCEVFDALTHERAWRGAWEVDAALAYIAEQAGKRFDPGLATTFGQLVREMAAAHGSELDRQLAAGAPTSALLELRRAVMARAAG